MLEIKHHLMILEMCLEQKFMTLKQITKMFFSESPNEFDWPMKCVRKLVNAGLLRGVRPHFSSQVLYVVTLRGAALLKKHNLSSGLRAIKEIDERNFEHDGWVTDVRIIFEKLLGFTNWIPERVLKKKNVRRKVPDGIATYDDHEHVIEVERTLKNKRAYEKIFLNTCITDYPNADILYIVANETDKTWLMKQAEGWQNIYFTTMNELLQMNWGVRFKSKGLVFKFERQEQGGVHFNIPEEEVTDENDAFFEECREADRECERMDAEYKKQRVQALSNEENHESK